MNTRTWTVLWCACLGAALPAQQAPRAADKKGFQTQAASTVGYSIRADGQETMEITNVAYEMTGSGIPGRPRDERLLLRKTVHTKEFVDEIGMEASTTVQAWPLGSDIRQKPLYTVAASGFEPKTIESDLMVISRGVEETEWWSVYALGTGSRLFDTYVPVLRLSTGWTAREWRYGGLEVPSDDAADARLRAPNVVAVLTYASASKVLREALITCDNRELAQLLRSFADSTHKATVVESRKARGEPSFTIVVSVSPSSPATYTVSVPVAKDDLDLAHATVPAGLHVVAWKR